MFAIKEMREHAGMTQQQAADAMNVKRARYGDWERETHIINLRDAIRLADIFNCTLDELAGRSHPSLTDDESTIIGAYRATDGGNRERLLEIARMDLERAERIASQKREKSA